MTSVDTARNRRVPLFRLRVTPQRLREAALEGFYARGYAATRVEDITHGLGVTKTAFYAHFGTKHAILESLVAEYCVGDTAKLADGPIAWTRALLDGRARKVLTIVLREWGSDPELARLYLASVRFLLARQPSTTDLNALERDTRSAVAAAVTEIMFGDHSLFVIDA